DYYCQVYDDNTVLF
nr:immunoglobulin light chain junction region [Macaca mulatta]